MTTTVTLKLSNVEVYRLFTRELKEGANFYEQVMNKLSGLLRCCKEKRVEAFLRVHQLSQEISRTTEYMYDELDKFEGILEKKKHLAGKKFTFNPAYFPEVRFDSGIACSLVELFEVYDHLISLLKLLRVAGCFSNDDDYFNNLRRYFKKINRLLSLLLLTSVNKLFPITFEDLLNQSKGYEDHVAIHGPLDSALLLKAIHSHVVPRLEEKIRLPLLTYLNHQRDEPQNSTAPLREEQGAA